MKKSLLTPLVVALVAAFALVAAPQATEAGGHGSSRKQVSTCSSCRQPVYAYQQYAGRQSCGTPIYRWVTQQHSNCRHRSHSSSSRSHSSSYGRSPSSHNRYGSSYGRSPSYGSSYSRGRSGFSVSFGRGGSSCR